MIARESLILAGVELLPLIFADSIVALTRRSGDGLEKAGEIAVIQGPARSLLTGERTALNFVQRLSGVATLAAAYVRAVKGTQCRILDTRKTTPGLRRLEKMAAAAGGVVNHRMGLFDAVLIKNNHITAAGGVRAALERTRNAGVPVEIEVRTREELEEALACGATRLLLDNLSPAEAKEWIAYIKGRATVELSGGITLENARAYAETGADFISSGAITHSAPAVDINFRIE
jgi:nicotinate-nucleotide pyrophosphorylase (carboxylating)